MISSADYIRASMEYNLFWVRIMKEHAIFIEASLPPPLADMSRQAVLFKMQYSELMEEAFRLSSGVVSRGALHSGQFYTNRTEAAEKAVKHLTGIETSAHLTHSEYNIEPLTSLTFTPQTEQAVSQLNTRLLNLTEAFVKFKSDLLKSVLACNIFTLLYPADIEHMMHEAMKYAVILRGLQNKDENYNTDYRDFWNKHMADHAKSIRGLFDPTETAFIGEADRYAHVYDALRQAPQTISSLPETRDISSFKATVTQGILACKIKSIMSPLFTDHLQREANHYIYLLQD